MFEAESSVWWLNLAGPVGAAQKLQPNEEGGGA